MCLGYLGSGTLGLASSAPFPNPDLSVKSDTQISLAKPADTNERCAWLPGVRFEEAELLPEPDPCIKPRTICGAAAPIAEALLGPACSMKYATPTDDSKECSADPIAETLVERNLARGRGMERVVGHPNRVRYCSSEEPAEQDDATFQKSLAEAAAAVLSTFAKGKVICLNFLFQVQPECDCMPVADVPVIQDQGIMISDDLVAAEQASLDMLRTAPALPQSAADEAGVRPGDDVMFKINPRPMQLQIDEAERLGLGTKEYELVKIEP